MDFLPELLGLPRFRSSFNNRIVSKTYDIEVPYISYNDLIKSKQALSRSKDIEDIDELRSRKDKPE
jgi:hypothetical protein